MTFKFDRYDVEPVALREALACGTSRIDRDDGTYVLAEDAINREAVNADKIRLLEVQLKEAKLALAKAQSDIDEHAVYLKWKGQRAIKRENHGSWAAWQARAEIAKSRE